MTLSDVPATTAQAGICEQAAWLQHEDTGETEAEGGPHGDPKPHSRGGCSQGPQAIRGIPLGRWHLSVSGVNE